MKKNGFTLAEVLITLAIIGVVATLTLPALMTNTAEQQAKSAFKKGINTLTEAAQLNQAVAGYDYSSLISTSTDDSDSQGLYGLLASRTSVDYKRCGTGKIESHQGDSKDKMATTNYTLFFRDGSALSFPATAVSESKYGEGDGVREKGTDIMTDGLPYGLPALYDTNGTKGPNIVSNCKGQALGADVDDQSENPTTQCTPQNRVIKDQFGVRLRGGFAVPNGVAARWAFEN
mgnify:CR=1 FL=1